MGQAHTRSLRMPVSTHPAFVPLISVWLAALVGGCVAVLPPAIFAAGAEPTDFAYSQWTVAGLAAMFGAATGYVSAEFLAILQGRTKRSSKRQPAPVEALAIEQTAVAATEYLPERAEPEAANDEPELIEDAAPVAEPAASDSLQPAAEELAQPEEPHYADIVLSELLGAPQPLTGEPAQEENAQDAVARDAIPEATPETEIVAAAAASAIEANAPGAFRGKAVSLLRDHETRDLAMPQLIERFAVALDDHRMQGEGLAHSYSVPAPPASVTQRLKAILEQTSQAAREA